MRSAATKQTQRHYEKTAKGKAVRYKIMRKYDANHRLENRARQIIRNGVFRGKITRPTICEQCGKEGKTQSHHEDYSKPLEVEWLCKECHGKKPQGGLMKTKRGRGDETKTTTPRQGKPPPASQEFEGGDFEDVSH